MSRTGVKFILIVLILIIIAVAVYFMFFFYYKCSDMICYQSHQEKCAKTKYINDGKESTWEYIIEGKTNGKCVIKATLLNIKAGSFTAEKVRLEGKSLTCYLMLGSTKRPEEDLTNCHGILKEEIQEIMIKNAHTYILKNLGQINEELEKPVL